MTEEVHRPPEAALIEEARLRLPRNRSAVAKVAKRAGISEARWRQVAKGYQQATKETRVPVRAPAETLARMAEAVNLTADDLEQVGRQDAAEIMREQRTRMARGLASLMPTELNNDVGADSGADAEVEAEARTDTTRITLGHAMDYAESVADLLARVSTAKVDDYTRTLLTRAQAHTIAYLYAVVSNAPNLDNAVERARAVARKLGDDPLFLSGFDLALKTIADIGRTHAIEVGGVVERRGGPEILRSDTEEEKAIDVAIPGGYGHVAFKISGSGDSAVKLHDTPPPSDQVAAVTPNDDPPPTADDCELVARQESDPKENPSE